MKLYQLRNRVKFMGEYPDNMEVDVAVNDSRFPDGYLRVRAIDIAVDPLSGTVTVYADVDREQ